MWPFGRPRWPVNGLAGCVGDGHDKENGQHARESNPIEKNEFNRRGGSRSAGIDAAASERAVE